MYRIYGLDWIPSLLFKQMLLAGGLIAVSKSGENPFLLRTENTQTLGGAESGTIRGGLG